MWFTHQVSHEYACHTRCCHKILVTQLSHGHAPITHELAQKHEWITWCLLWIRGRCMMYLTRLDIDCGWKYTSFGWSVSLRIGDWPIRGFVLSIPYNKCTYGFDLLGSSIVKIDTSFTTVLKAWRVDNTHNRKKKQLRWFFIPPVPWWAVRSHYTNFAKLLGHLRKHCNFTTWPSNFATRAQNGEQRLWFPDFSCGKPPHGSTVGWHFFQHCVQFRAQ